jgi:hypothetical protein
MLLDPQNVRAEMPAEIDQLGIAGAAAQTRMVSAGEFWPSQQELSRDLKYMARARIPEFESDERCNVEFGRYFSSSLPARWSLFPRSQRGIRD